MTTQAVAVRRQADLHRDAASLGKLISEIKGDAAQLTSDWWVGLWPNEEHDQRFARRQWITKFGGEVGDHLDPAIPAADLATLTAGAASVKGYVDKHVAHSEDPGPVPAQTSVTLDEVHDAIDVIGGLFRRYYLLFTAGDMVFLEPIIQHDWLAPFRMPWIRGSK